MARRDSVMTKPKDSRGTLVRLLRFLGPFKALIALVAVLCVISNLLALFGPNLAGSAINPSKASVGVSALVMKVSSLMKPVLPKSFTSSMGL